LAGSVVHYLQDKIAMRELELQRRRAAAVDVQYSPSTASGGSSRPSTAAVQTLLHPTADADRGAGIKVVSTLAYETARDFGSGISRAILDTPHLSRHAFFLPLPQPLSASLSDSRKYPDAPSCALTSSADFDQQASSPTSLDQVPLAIAELLAKCYIEKVVPCYPFFNGSELWDCFNKVYHSRAGDHGPSSEYDQFVVAMMLATTISTSKFKDISKVASNSFRIFQNALKHCSCLQKTSIESLQGLLMLVQYCYFIPQAGDLVDLAGLAMRMALELGLHKDPLLPGSHGWKPELRPASVDFRRRLFWVMYSMERSICSTNYQRVGILDHFIDVEFPSELGDPSCDGDSGRANDAPVMKLKARFFNGVRFRQIQSEILTVNFLQRDQPFNGHDQDYEAWVAEMGARISSWRNRLRTDDSESVGPDWFNIAVAHATLILHRPCPRNPMPRPESLIKCFEAARQVASATWEYAHSGFFKYSWHAVHQAFQAGVALLFSIRHCKEKLKEIHGIQRILETVQLFSSLFVLSSERWSAAVTHGDAYERMKAVVLQELMRPWETRAPNDDDELDRLALPQKERPRQSATTTASGPPSLSPDQPGAFSQPVTSTAYPNPLAALHQGLGSPNYRPQSGMFGYGTDGILGGGKTWVSGAPAARHSHPKPGTTAGHPLVSLSPHPTLDDRNSNSSLGHSQAAAAANYEIDLGIPEPAFGEGINWSDLDLENVDMMSHHPEWWIV
jgi:hypothetical protein